MRRLRVWAVAGVAGLAIATLGGCITLPTSGPVNNTGLVGGSGYAAEVTVPRPPGTGWTPSEIVIGFLAASGSESLSVARDYLTPGYSQQWSPSLRSPTVINLSLPDLASSLTTGPKISLGVNSGTRIVNVQFTSDHVETLQGPGNIVVSAKKQTYVFSLTDTSDGWRINSLQRVGGPPSDAHTLLLLTQPDFKNDYQPRNLYFFAGDTLRHVLVPIPIFIPQAQTQAGAQALADKLLRVPKGWLDATTTAFPPGTSIGSVQVSGIKAVVTLDPPAATSLTEGQLHQIEAQLVWTLTSSPYPGGEAGIGSVQLVVRNGPSQLLLPHNFGGWVPRLSSGPLYFQVLGPSDRPVLKSVGQTGPVTMPTPPGLGTGLFTAIAVSPGVVVDPMLAACRGRDVYLAPLRWRARVIKKLLPVACTSLSWDSNGDLWATTANNVSSKNSDVYQVVAIGHKGLIRPPKVSEVLMGGLKLPAPGHVLQYRVLSFQVAPDGVRAAMIVQSRAGIELVVAVLSSPPGPYFFLQQAETAVQVVGADIPHPIALSWQNPDNLLVLGSQLDAPPSLYQVPLNGGPSFPSLVSVLPGVRWLAVNQQGVAVGSARGQIWRSRSWNGPWTRPIRGNMPFYSN